MLPWCNCLLSQNALRDLCQRFATPSYDVHYPTSQVLRAADMNLVSRLLPARQGHKRAVLPWREVL